MGRSGPATSRKRILAAVPVRQPLAVHVARLEHPLDVVAGLVERDQLDPVDQVVRVAAARIAVQPSHSSTRLGPAL